MIKIEILGTAANWSKPFRNKNIKKFTSCFFKTDYKFQIDTGNSWDKREINYLLITHLHKDHIGRLKTYPESITVCVPSKTFLSSLDSQRTFLFLKKKIKIGETKIEPFLVHHSKKTLTLTYGYKISFRNSSFLWLPDYFSPFNYSSFKNCDIWFLDASSFKRNIKHHGYLLGHKSIFNSFLNLRKRKIFPESKKVYLIHLGLSMFSLNKKVNLLQEQFPEYKIIPTFDGMKINL